MLGAHGITIERCITPDGSNLAYKLTFRKAKLVRLPQDHITGRAEAIARTCADFTLGLSTFTWASTPGYSCLSARPGSRLAAPKATPATVKSAMTKAAPDAAGNSQY